MSELKTNKLTPTANCGTVTLGDSGDIFTIPSGATLTNSGSINNSGTITNTGTISGGTISGTLPGVVDWDTTPKTANFTAVSGEGYFVDTTLGAITVTLPSSPSAGDYVSIKDYANTADTNNITIDRNGSNIQGITNNFIIDTEGLAITLLYSDATQGWISTGAAQASDITEGPSFIVATGGTITCDGDFKIHTFTGPGTFTVSSLGNPQGGPNSIDYLVVAGGGGGETGCGGSAGGGGAGGYRTSFPSPAGTTPVTVQGYPITVGAGGAINSSGNPSVFNSITSTGGGRGGRRGLNNAAPGGSGGGGAGPPLGAAGTGNTPPTSPPQGNNGGNGDVASTFYAGGGGGGASAVGTNGVSSPPGTGGNGGAGTANSITGSPVFYAGGGGGEIDSPNVASGLGGNGGGGAGSVGPSGPGTFIRNAASGTTNTGGGGGSTFSGVTSPSGAGGSGVVVIRYKFQ